MQKVILSLVLILSFLLLSSDENIGVKAKTVLETERDSDNSMVFYGPDYVFFQELYIGHGLEKDCGEDYYRIENGLLEVKTTVVLWWTAWVVVPTHVYHGRLGQYIYARGYEWVANGFPSTKATKVQTILDWCECFMEADPTYAIEKYQSE